MPAVIDSNAVSAFRQDGLVPLVSAPQFMRAVIDFEAWEDEMA